MTAPASGAAPTRTGMLPFEVRVDLEACCSSGRCAATEPTVFDQDPLDGTVVLLQARPPAELLADVQLCADLCPCGAIEVIET